MSTIFLDRAARMHEILRQSAKNQLDSYADEWIVVFEALQNALDAVEGVEGARVRIEFDIGANRVRVYDNGPGFNPEKDQFGLGSGTKFNLQNPKIRGEHGVGM